ncbi:uncharacterized protein LOC110038411 isoform X2 [Phalaenopsis equestris]|uniref:uncharacterized protein LOC110038411 isoform X2 n=1 Tax=Phalaenopsis equestris TaxID=78828 RepID=UPI0009E3E7E8|nr:uncharacterized protein LOC110038411 isoform X2 [Phalaenopsis equestris]
MAQKPLMLKDYLELDSYSEAFWWTPIQHTAGTRVRSLLEAELSGGAADKGGWKLIRLRSKGALTRLSAVIKLLQSSTNFKTAAFPTGGGGPPRFLPRNFSKARIRSFWKRSGNEKKDLKVMLKDVVRLTSFDEETVERGSLFNLSPGISGYSSSHKILSSTASSNSFVDGKESLPLSPRTEKGIFAGGGEKSLRPSTGSQEPEEISGKVDMDCPFEEEKEQFSPVSVMDFPYRDEDENDAVVEQPSLNSSSFDQSIINIERAKNQLLEKIRRFESLALDSVDLDYHFACTAAHVETTVRVETDEEKEGYLNDDQWRRGRTASSLLRRLPVNDSRPVYGQRLLFDFFVEGLSLAEECLLETKSGYGINEELLKLASGWVSGGEILAEYKGETVVREMERSGGEWRRFQKEKEILIIDMTKGVVTWLMEELVDDLLS